MQCILKAFYFSLFVSVSASAWNIKVNQRAISGSSVGFLIRFNLRMTVVNFILLWISARLDNALNFSLDI